MAVSEREKLAAAARAVDLRLTRQDLDALLGAWQRYRRLMAALEATMTADALPE